MFLVERVAEGEGERGELQGEFVNEEMCGYTGTQTDGVIHSDGTLNLDCFCIIIIPILFFILAFTCGIVSHTILCVPHCAHRLLHC